jgi:hypothetical protein
MHYTAQLTQRSSQSVLYYHQLCDSAKCFSVLNFVKLCLLKSKAKVTVLKKGT